MKEHFENMVDILLYEFNFPLEVRTQVITCLTVMQVFNTPMSTDLFEKRLSRFENELMEVNKLIGKDIFNALFDSMIYHGIQIEEYEICNNYKRIKIYFNTLPEYNFDF